MPTVATVAFAAAEHVPDERCGCEDRPRRELSDDDGVEQHRGFGTVARPGEGGRCERVDRLA
jgi:hypothetical protein